MIMLNTFKKRYRLRIIIPAYPAFNIYSSIARRTTALGPVCVASAANETPGWDVEVIDENNLRRYGPRSRTEGANHEFLQGERPADVVGLYGGLTSTIPRLYEIAKFYKDRDNWIRTMRSCIAINASFFNTNRMVQQYVLNAYFM